MADSLKLVQLMLPLAFAMSTATEAQTVTVQTAPRSPALSSMAAGQANLATGEVLEVDKKGKRVLLKHGPIRNLGMDAMTMEFLVPDANLLSSLKAGDKVRFAAVWKEGDYVLTRIQVLPRRGSKRPVARGVP